MPALLLSLLLAESLVLHPRQPPLPQLEAPRRASDVQLGRKFENNKLKMAKTALAYAKKASYIGKKVVSAVKAAGADPETNRALAAVMSEANALNVPKDVVERNIKKGLSTDTEDFKELTYEAYGLGGAGLIINCLSDNHRRSTTDVNAIINKNGCKIASSGSVTFNFQRKGRLVLTKELDEETMIDLAIEAECEGDVELEAPDPDGRNDGEEVKCVVITDATELGAMQSALQVAGYECSGTLIHAPLATVEVSDEDEASNFAAIDKLEELDDVTNVEHNMAVVQ